VPSLPKTGVTLYSFTSDFQAGKVTLEDLIAKVGRLQLGPGLEIVGYQMIRGYPHISVDFERRFKDLVDTYELHPTALDADVPLESRPGHRLSEDELVALLERQIEAARQLGFPVLKIQHQTPHAVIERVLAGAERADVRLAVEIHAPHSVDDPVISGLRELFDRLDSPFLGFLPDAGASARGVPSIVYEDFRRRGVSDSIIALIDRVWHAEGDPFEREARLAQEVPELGGDEVALAASMMAMDHFGRQDPKSWAEIMPRVLLVHGKFFGIDAAGEEPTIDYAALLSVLVEGGYSGYISSEYEGFHWVDADAFEMVRRHQDLCRQVLMAAQ
jgi:sugar phosphate isomerase/epimerase